MSASGVRGMESGWGELRNKGSQRQKTPLTIEHRLSTEDNRVRVEILKNPQPLFISAIENARCSIHRSTV